VVASVHRPTYILNVVCNDRINFLIRAFRKSEFYEKIATPFSQKQTKNNTSITVFMNDENVRKFPVQILFNYPSEHITVSNLTVRTRNSNYFFGLLYHLLFGSLNNFEKIGRIQNLESRFPGEGHGDLFRKNQTDAGVWSQLDESRSKPSPQFRNSVVFNNFQETIQSSIVRQLTSFGVSLLVLYP